MTSVLLASPVPNAVPVEYLASVTTLMLHRPGALAHYLPLRCSGRVDVARNECVHMFLSQTSAEWLWFVDSDMTFGPDILAKLLAAADADERPVVSGVCVIAGPAHVGYPPQDHKPGIAAWYDGERPDRQVTELPDNDHVIRIGWAGAACLLMHREVLVSMARRSVEDNAWPMVKPWFAEEIDATGRAQSEDMTFCNRLRAMGVPLHLATGARTGHVKSYTWTYGECVTPSDPVRLVPA